MNFLEITRSVYRESGLSGGIPASYTTATGDSQRLFEWVNWAARDITLMRESWRWRRGSATLASTVSIANPSASFGLTDFASWKSATMSYKPSAYRIVDGIGQEHELAWMEYDAFRKQFLMGLQVTASVQYWSISPSEEFLIGPAPDSAHFIRADYIKDYVALANDTDIPSIPVRFHMLIVWRALMEYGGFDAAGEVYQRAEKNYMSIIVQLMQSQNDMPTIASRALA